MRLVRSIPRSLILSRSIDLPSQHPRSAAEALEPRTLLSGIAFTLGTVIAGSFGDSIVAVDLNADGRPDLAIAGGGTATRPTASVLLNTGNGNFTAATDYPIGTGPNFVVAADLNEDGRPDLAIANDQAGTVTVLLNNGDGTFATGTNYQANSTSGVAVADINADGQPDIIVSADPGFFNTDQNTKVGVLLNNGNGTFAPEATYPFAISRLPTSLATADFNRDGKPDLAIANCSVYGGDNVVSILLNNGHGGFAVGANYPVGLGSQAPIERITVADFNADGSTDLAVTSYGNSFPYDSVVTVLLNKDDGTFTTRGNYPCGVYAVAVTAVDLDGDGRPDLAVANSDNNSSGSVSVLPNKGDGAFGALTGFLPEQYGYGVAAADLNNDGRPDLAVSGYSGGSTGHVRVLINTTIPIPPPAPPPDVLTLANLSENVYGGPTGYGDYDPAPGEYATDSSNGFAAGAYINSSGTQVVVAFRGTVISRRSFAATAKDLAADISFGGDTPNDLLTSQVDDAAAFLSAVSAQYPRAGITLTGHSLGGALAELAGKASGFATYAFDAPGPGLLYSNLSEHLRPVAGLGNSTTLVNYRVYGDQISLFGAQLGTSITLAQPPGTKFSAFRNPLLNAMANAETFLNLHQIATFIGQLVAGAPVITDTSGEPNDAAVLESYIQPTSTTASTGTKVFEFAFTVSQVTDLYGALLDPSEGDKFILTEEPGSPSFASVDLPGVTGVDSYAVRCAVNGIWTSAQKVLPGTEAAIDPGASAVEFTPLDSMGGSVAITEPFLFDANFSAQGTFSGAVTELMAPAVAATTIGDGSTSRSQVTRLSVQFSQPVALGPGALGLSQLTTDSTGAVTATADVSTGVAWSSPDGGTTWVASVVAGGPIDGGNGSLSDGVYRLTLHPAAVTSDSNGLAMAGGDQVLSTFHRLFGDTDGNGTVNALDYARFKQAFGSSSGAPGYNPALDFDGNGTVNALDYAQFKKRFGMTFIYS